MADQPSDRPKLAAGRGACLGFDRAIKPDHLFADRRHHSAAAAGAGIQIAWLQRAVVGFLVAGFFGSYSGITMFYLILGTLWAVAHSVPQPQPLLARFGPRPSLVR